MGNDRSIPERAPLTDTPRLPFPALDEAARRDSLRATLATGPVDAALWVFAYGSLMWNPCFAYDDRLPGRLRGYCRRFSAWTVLARGTPERPGLGLCLEPGPGHCTGLLFRLDPAARDHGLAALWEREMVTGIYRPSWLAVEAETGPVTALAFVVDPDHPQYAGIRSQEEAAAIIAAAAGKFGRCRDYLADLVQALAGMEVPDSELETLLELVDRKTPAVGRLG